MASHPVVLIVFNRPQHTRRTFEAIRRQKPERLFIIGDGPRPGFASDIERCLAVKEVVRNIDWPCKVDFNYAKKNMGLKQRVASGLDWVFSNVESAIILEDDCVPNPDFFFYCNSLLDRYWDNSLVSVISGSNFQRGRERGDASYYFSKYCHCWGWATWRRAWKFYNHEISFWPQWRDSLAWEEFITDRVERNYWEKIFNQVYDGKFNSWAYPWLASVWKFGGLTATPNVNLISNIGFDEYATHTIVSQNINSNIPVQSLNQNFNHPIKVEVNYLADRYNFDNTFYGKRYRFPWNIFYLPRRGLGLIFRTLREFSIKVNI